MKIVGILSFQGDFAEHQQVLKTLHAQFKDVRSKESLRDCTHLIIPGGESTVMSHFLTLTGMAHDIRKRVNDGSLAIFGTCAGAILLAKKITGKHVPPSLGLLDITIERNAYGRQIDSFDASITVKGLKKNIPVAFIRAPIITKVGSSVEILATHEGHPILVRSGRLLASTCHPEARNETAIHEMFHSM